MSASRETGRRRGNIEERNGALRVRYYAGLDPITGRQVYRRATIKGTNKAAWKRAENKLADFQAQVAKQHSAESAVRFDYALGEWMRTNEVEESTRHTYEGYVDRTIRPALGDTPVNKLTARSLETFYTELRRCRVRCDGKPFIEKHKKRDDHDCVESGCKPHTCKPMAASTIRQIHFIVSGTLDAAERWEWISSNPAKVVRKPKQKPPQPDPPTPAEAARISEEAFRLDDDWGTLVWLAMTTGMRRGELLALRFSRLDFDNGVIDLRRNWVGGKEKDTKTHQNRRIALDTETIVLLQEHRERVRERVESLGTEFADELFLFSARKNPDHREPYTPDAVSSRYINMAERLGITTHLHALRHYSATELLTAGVDLPTVSGRLGHGGGGATTLRVYAAWVAASDRKAAEILGSRMPKRQSRPRS